jgi:hypothetical protein
MVSLPVLSDPQEAPRYGISAVVQGFGSALQLMLARHDAALQALPSAVAQSADLQQGLQSGKNLSLIEVWSPQSPGINTCITQIMLSRPHSVWMDASQMLC